MNSSRTLWMGNIDPWMKEEHLIHLFNSYNFFPLNLIIKHKQTKKGCCFVEFESTSIASAVLETLNGIQISPNFSLKLNWVNDRKDYHYNIDSNQGKKFTIYVGNLHKKITNDELKGFFKDEFPSVISAKVIYDPNTHESKGFGFVDLSDYQDYLRILSNKTPKICRTMRLMINPAKSKREEEFSYDYNTTTTSTTPSNSNVSSYSPLNSYVSIRDSQYTNGYPNNNNSNSNSNYSYNQNHNNHSNHHYKNSPRNAISNTIQIDSFIDSTQNNLPKPLERKSNDEFALALQKGFKDIVNMYTTSYSKPKVSFSCIYFCNLNVKYDNKSYAEEFQQYIEFCSKKVLDEM